MQFLSSFVLAVAVSFDGLGAGFAYGIRNLEIPFYSILTISLSSSLALLMSMLLGSTMAIFFLPGIAQVIGGSILILVGGYIIKSAVFAGQAAAIEKPSQGKFVGSIGGILREPERADFDNSGSISLKEAVFLGIALALDAFGAGFGAAMAGYSPLITCFFVGLCKLLFLGGGVYMGKHYRNSFAREKGSWLAGSVLILLGFLNII
ncbi:MAG TPA: sporulation membrane protein YtaF [Firmicutes bacterium]|nr:sporulation membrane protein YtaF [Bacillota bacterium]